jgi:ParB family chromosome partitioning protein
VAFLKKRGLYELNRVIRLPVHEIRPNPAQPRRQFDPEALSELASSIYAYGILQPLTVRRCQKGFELVAGERRLRAAKLAGLSEVPCLVLDVGSPESSILALIENLHRRDLDFIEEAEGISRLISLCGLSQEEAARKIGKSQSAVANKLRILRLPPEILCVLREKGLSERHARALLRLETDPERAAALDVIVREEMNVARAEAYIEALCTKKNEPEPAKKPARPIFVLKDVRLFLNTVNRGMTMMKQSGIDAEYGKSETDTDIVLTIKIPKGGAAAR